MSHLSVSSSNSLRRSSPSARKRAQSLGRLGELVEGQLYEYEVLSDKEGSATCWQDRIRLARTDSGSPKLNGALQRAKSTCDVGGLSEATPLVTPQRASVTSGRRAPREGAGLRQRPISCHTNMPTMETSGRAHLKLEAEVSHLPDLLSSSRETLRRPQSSYDHKVTPVM